jgi:hypothetical protein
VPPRTRRKIEQKRKSDVVAVEAPGDVQDLRARVLVERRNDADQGEQALVGRIVQAFQKHGRRDGALRQGPEQRVHRAGDFQGGGGR